MDVRLDGQVLLVTGSTQGLGEKIARLAISSGVAGLIISGRNQERGQNLSAELSCNGTRVAFVAADLSDADGPALLMDAALARFGRIDLLVNSAGLTDRASVLDGTIETWDRLFAVNARAPFFLMQRAVADMLRRNAPGAIVNIVSMNAYCGTPELAIYSATKGALATLTKNVANACLARNIRVNGINMGWAATDGEQRMQAETLGKGADWATLVAASMPLGRLLSDDEVARLTLFLLSAQSGLMTGALIDLEQAVIGAPAGSQRF